MNRRIGEPGNRGPSSPFHRFAVSPFRPSAGSRPLLDGWWALAGFEGPAFAQELFHPARVQLALETADAIEEEFTVQMVEFVLQGDSEQVLGLQGDLFLVWGPGLHLNLGCAPDLGCVVNHTEAAFLPEDVALTSRDDWVDQFEQLLAWFLRVQVEDDDALRDADLHRCQAYPRRRVHGQHHVVHELDKVAADVLDRSGSLFETGIRVVQDFSEHYPDL